MADSDGTEELTPHARQERARLREQIADAHQRLGEAQHATEDVMHRAAHKLPDPARVHARANRLSERADEHLRRAERERVVTDADEDD